jgi:hypothetical protein
MMSEQSTEMKTDSKTAGITVSAETTISNGVSTSKIRNAPQSPSSKGPAAPSPSTATLRTSLSNSGLLNNNYSHSANSKVNFPPNTSNGFG